MKPFVLRDGQVTELTVPMFHGGAISGRVLDAHGDPVDFAQVRVLRVPRGGRVTSAGQAQTNDLGEYRVPRLQPGRYLVQVRPQMNQNYQGPNLHRNARCRNRSRPSIRTRRRCLRRSPLR